MELLIIPIYLLIGFYVYVKAIKMLRKRSWIPLSTAVELSILYLFFWPVAVTALVISKIKNSKLAEKFENWINGK